MAREEPGQEHFRQDLQMKNPDVFLELPGARTSVQNEQNGAVGRDEGGKLGRGWIMQGCVGLGRKSTSCSSCKRKPLRSWWPAANTGPTSLHEDSGCYAKGWQTSEKGSVLVQAGEAGGSAWDGSGDGGEWLGLGALSKP